MFTVTPAAVEMINDMVSNSENEKLKLTICSSGVGCGGPSLKVDMRTILKDDIVETINGQTFRIRTIIHKNLEGSEIDAEDTFWGKRLHVKTSYKCL